MNHKTIIELEPKTLQQEVVFLTISKENGCGYCVAAHSMVADKMSGVPSQAWNAKGEQR